MPLRRYIKPTGLRRRNAYRMPYLARFIPRPVPRRVQEIRKRLNGTATGGVTVNWSGTCYPLSDIGTGSALDQRAGRQITPKYVSVKYYATLDGSAAHSVLTIIVFSDSETGSPATPSQVLEVTGQTNAPISMLNMHNSPRFTVHRRVQVNIVAETNDSGNNVGGATGEFYVPLTRMKNIHYTGVNATDYGMNNLFMLVISNEQTNAPVMHFTTVFAYTDS